MSFNPLTGLDEDEVLTDSDREEIERELDIQQDRYKLTETEEGGIHFQFNENGGIFHQVAAMDANRNGGEVNIDKYLKAVRESAFRWSSRFNGSNQETLQDAAFRSVWFDGAKEMFGEKLTEAHVQHVISEIFNRTGATAELKQMVPAEDIDKQIKRADAAKHSAHARIGKLYKKEKEEWVIDENTARSSADLYNLWMQQRWVKGKAEAYGDMRERYWQETQGDKEMPEAASAFYEHAEAFANWAREEIQGEQARYSELWQACAREEIYKRLIQARDEDPDLSLAEEQEIVASVLRGKDGAADAAWDDAIRWRSVLTEEDLNELKRSRYHEYEKRAPEGVDEALTRVKEDIRDYQEQADEQGYSTAGKKRLKAEEKAQKDAERKREKEEEKIKEAKENDMDYGPYRVNPWRAHGKLRGDQSCAAVSTKLVKELKEKLYYQPGDQIYAQVQKGGKTFIFPIVAGSSEDNGLLLSYAAIKEMKNKRDKKLEYSGNDKIKYTIKRKKNLR